MDHAPDIQARPVGQPAARLDKRAGDDRPYLIDLTPLMRKGEVVAAIEAASCPGVTVVSWRSRRGAMAELRLAGGDVAERRPYSDHPLTLRARTTLGLLVVVIDVRVHRS